MARSVSAQSRPGRELTPCGEKSEKLLPRRENNITTTTIITIYTTAAVAARACKRFCGCFAAVYAIIKYATSRVGTGARWMGLRGVAVVRRRWGDGGARKRVSDN